MRGALARAYPFGVLQFRSIFVGLFLVDEAPGAARAGYPVDLSVVGCCAYSFFI